VVADSSRALLKDEAYFDGRMQVSTTLLYNY